MGIKIIIALILAFISGFLYRLGGMSQDCPPAWIPKAWRKRWVRAWLIPPFSLASLFLWWGPSGAWWMILLMSLLSWGLMGGFLTTYWDWLTKIWRKTEDEYWENWLLHGFFVGLGATLPFLWVGMAWWIILANCVVSGLLMMAISEFSGNVWVEEIGRGFVATITRIIH
jgi:hypothetical protein